MLSKKYRLSHRDFKRPSKEGFYRQNEWFKFFICPNQIGYSRWAVVVSTDWSKSSVERHKIKRQLMNLIKDKKELLKLAYDITIWPQQSLREKDFIFIKEKFDEILNNLINHNEPNH